MDRRDFLRHAGGIGAGAALAQLGLLSSRAQAAIGDYKALVCIFLAGGNDGNNTIVPVDTAGYAGYSAIRGPLALAQGSLVPLPEAGGALRFGLHPGLAALAPIWNAQQMAVLLNVGTLLQPLTLAQYRASNSVRPLDLFSHIDQQNQWQSAISDVPGSTGWGGRIAEQLAGANAGSGVPAMITTAGNNLFVTGQAARALAVPVSGSFGLNGSGVSGAALARTSAFSQLLAVDKDALLVDAAQEIVVNGLNYSAALSPVLANNTIPAASPFATLTSGISKQLLAVTKIIAARTTFSVRRQIFFVSLGGFDTHTSQLGAQATLFGQLGPAVKAFHDAMTLLGESANVTAFTLSDFSRTLKPTADGSDHAWGNNHFIIGGAVRGQRFYGTYPTLALGGPDDVSQEGRWIPTTALDQYAATLASWFGVSAPGLAGILPNLSRFPVANLGFV
jgi:uncharacterized protein (DUF1501 family)